MTLSQNLLYLLLLYAVLDKDKKLSLTTGLLIAFVIILFTGSFGNNNNNRCRRRNFNFTEGNPFTLLNETA